LLLLSAAVTVAAFVTLLATIVPAQAGTAAGVSAVAAGLGLLGVLLSVADRQGALRWRMPFRR
jgi:hypothetical protein